MHIKILTWVNSPKLPTLISILPSELFLTNTLSQGGGGDGKSSRECILYWIYGSTYDHVCALVCACELVYNMRVCVSLCVYTRLEVMVNSYSRTLKSCCMMEYTIQLSTSSPLERLSFEKCIYTCTRTYVQICKHISYKHT